MLYNDCVCVVYYSVHANFRRFRTARGAESLGPAASSSGARAWRVSVTERMRWVKVECSGVEPPAIAKHACAMVASRMYVIGGASAKDADGKATYNDVLTLDCDTMHWVSGVLRCVLERRACRGHLPGAHDFRPPCRCVLTRAIVGKVGSVWSEFR